MSEFVAARPAGVPFKNEQFNEPQEPDHPNILAADAEAVKPKRRAESERKVIGPTTFCAGCRREFKSEEWSYCPYCGSQTTLDAIEVAGVLYVRENDKLPPKRKRK
jgi:hypothetical protein